MKGKRIVVLFLSMFALTLTFLGVKSSAKNYELKLGTSTDLYKKNATYKSADKSIAYIDKAGLVTAKKIGTTTISVKKNGKSAVHTVNVIANRKKEKAINVSTGEVEITKNKITYVQGEIAKNYTATITVKNKGEIASPKVVVKGFIGTVKLRFNFGKVEAGKSKTVTLKGITTAVDKQIKLEKKYVYSRKMYTVYNYLKNKTAYNWGTQDKVAPVIGGFVGENSYNQKMPYQLVYSDDEKYDYFKYVYAKDDREGKVKLEVDTTKVNFKKAGTYKITYKATDKAGNISKATARIEVRKAKQVDAIADEVLSEIIKKKWSEHKKLNAIYNYTRKHISYVGYSNKKNWEKEAINGIRYGKGDCYTYYAVARILLTRAGFPNIEITRYKGEGHHWWNMVYTAGGWYHYDCGPRKEGGRFCLLTDAQLTHYSKTHENKYIWNYKIMPKTPKKKLSVVF